MSENNGSVDTGNPSAPPAGGEQGGVATPPPAWYAGIENPEIRGFAENKGWKDAGAAIESYRNLEKLQGVPPERLAKIPEANDTEGWKAFNSKFGWAAPDTPDAYDLPVPEGANNAYANKMKAVFHELGIPADKAKALVEKSNGVLAELGQGDEEAFKTSVANDLAKLKSDWGGNFDELHQLADRARQEILPSSGLTAEQLDLMEDLVGPATMIRLFAAIGQKTGEAKFTAGGNDTNTGPMSPEAAKAKLDNLGQDKAWFARFESGDAVAVREFQQIMDVLARTNG